MKIALEKTFELASSIEKSWLVLKELEAVAVCMPGATIKQQLADNKWSGSVKVKVGPANMAFDGEIVLLKIDQKERLLELEASGKDAGSTATMHLKAHLEDKDQGCCLKGVADVTLNGKIVSLGGRMVKPLADQILDQFGKNFAAAVDKIEEIDSEQLKSQVLESAKSASAKSDSINSISLLVNLVKNFFSQLFSKKVKN